jgi:hypothetical protein
MPSNRSDAALEPVLGRYERPDAFARQRGGFRSNDVRRTPASGSLLDLATSRAARDTRPASDRPGRHPRSSGGAHTDAVLIPEEPIVSTSAMEPPCDRVRRMATYMERTGRPIGRDGGTLVSSRAISWRRWEPFRHWESPFARSIRNGPSKRSVRRIAPTTSRSSARSIAPPMSSASQSVADRLAALALPRRARYRLIPVRMRPRVLPRPSRMPPDLVLVSAADGAVMKILPGFRRNMGNLVVELGRVLSNARVGPR